MLIYEFLYDLLSLSLPINAIFYVVAASALLAKLNSTLVKLASIIETKKSTFFAYKLIFALILLECLLLVTFLTGLKQQIGVLIWIIYVSALMVLFLIFLALTISDSFFSYKKKNFGDFNISEVGESNLRLLHGVIYLFFSAIWVLTFSEVVYLLQLRQFVSPILNSAYNFNVGNSNIELINSNDIFNTIKRDFSNSPSHYLLSAALQAVCLLVVVFSLIF